MMMKYSEQSYGPSLSTSIELEDALSPVGENKLSLTPLWEYAIRTQCLPENLDLDIFFETIHERLRDPEWEVRQHALRVLVDFIPLIPTEILDEKIETVLEDLVTNLGNLGPAVRKGAVDSLRAYVNHSPQTNSIIKNLVERGIENAQENKVQTNVVLGIILSLPFLINNRLNDETLTYIIHKLLDKIVKVIHQETVLRALLRIREIIGHEKFDEALTSHETYNSKKQFELLCEVYDLHIYKSSMREVKHTPQIIQEEISTSDDPITNDEMPNINLKEDKVILETEIQLESGPSITMKIHEENSNDCMMGNDERSRTFKVLADIDEVDNYEHLRRTPRRVRFGGEIVKLRTPDSDSNNDEDATISIITDNKTDKPVIEIKYIENETKTTTRTSRSLIPIPIKQTQSAPNSPSRSNLYKSRIYKSSPNLSKSKRIQPKIYGKSRIPRRYNTEIKKNIETKIQIKIKEKEYLKPKIVKQTKIKMKKSFDEKKKNIPKIRYQENLKHHDILKPEENKIEIQKSEDAMRFRENLKHQDILSVKNKMEKQIENVAKLFVQEDLQKKKESPIRSPNKEKFSPIIFSRRNSREDEFSPVPIHNEIEVLHNLTRSPSPSFRNRKDSENIDGDNLEEDDIGKIKEGWVEKEETSENKIEDKINEKQIEEKEKSSNILQEEIKKPTDLFQALQIDKLDLQDSSISDGKEYPSFQIYNSSLSDGFYEFADSPIPTKDSGDCLTCSSSGSESVIGVERKYVENFGNLDNKIVEDLQNVDDIRARQRGLEELLRVIQTPSVLDSLRDRLPTLLYILFNAEQQPILQPIAEQSLSIIFTNMEKQCLITRLQQISLNLSKMGSPLGVRLAILLMRRIPPRLLVDQLLADPILGAKSSKVREGALQILMTVSRIFPSTDLNIPKSVKSVVSTLRDRKRKVRQAALETLAVLTQLSSPGMVLDVVTQVTEDWIDKEQILRVIRTRLSRKQLPAVNMNGNIRYSTPTGESEIEWLSRGSSSHSPQHSAHTPKPINEDILNNNDEFDMNSPSKLQRFYSARTETLSSGASLINGEKQTLGGSFTEGKPPKRFITEAFGDNKRFVVGAPNRFIDKNSNQSEDMNIAKENFNRFVYEERRRFVEDESGISRFPPVSPRKILSEDLSGSFEDDEGTSNRFVVLNGGENIGEVSEGMKSARKISYWRNNARRQMSEEKSDGSDWSKVSREEPVGRAPTTQIWAIDPSAFNKSEKLSTANGTLRQVYMVKTNESKTASTNTTVHNYKEGATNTSPVFRKSPRGRSFSPPSRKSDYDSYDEQETKRFINVSKHQREVARIRREERVRKSFSSEHISNIDRIRKENAVSSGSSSGSSVRQPSNWNRDLRSGIPVPIYPDTKLRIRNRNTNYKPKGPISIPYYPPVKSPSPQTTPEKFTLPEQPHLIGRQPFSSGSESSGYFTPPPEPNEATTPEATPQFSPKENQTPTTTPERFIQIETPKQSIENFTIIDSETESIADEELIIQKEEIQENQEEPKFERKSTSNSLDGFALKETEAFVDRRLSTKPNSLDETDFTQITFSEKRAISKSEVDITISAQISRKNVNSAPALNEILTDFQNYDEEVPIAKTSLPGSVVDSLEDTEAPEELFHSPIKKSPVKSTKSVRRKSCRLTNTNLSLYPDTLRPFTKPKDSLQEVAAQLESNEWEITMKGLQGLVRLIRHHKEYIEAQMHTVCVLLGKHIRNLRSQVARAACLAASELFQISKRPLELELDEIAAPLLHRTADTNKFLRSDANSALDEMSANLSVPRVVSVITCRGCGHQNAVVRCAAARLLCNIVHRLGAEKVFQLPRDTRDKILYSGANLLTEGSLETRKHAKMLLGHLAGHCQFQRAMTESVPSSVLRHIDKTLRSLMK